MDKTAYCQLFNISPQDYNVLDKLKKERFNKDEDILFEVYGGLYILHYKLDVSFVEKVYVLPLTKFLKKLNTLCKDSGKQISLMVVHGIDDYHSNLYPLIAFTNHLKHKATIAMTGTDHCSLEAVEGNSLAKSVPQQVFNDIVLGSPLAKDIRIDGSVTYFIKHKG